MPHGHACSKSVFRLPSMPLLPAIHLYNVHISYLERFVQMLGPVRANDWSMTKDSEKRSKLDNDTIFTSNIVGSLIATTFLSPDKSQMPGPGCIASSRMVGLLDVSNPPVTRLLPKMSLVFPIPKNRERKATVFVQYV